LAGADTVSPNTTTILSADTYLDGRIKIKWDTITLNENGAPLEAGDTGLAGWYIFRASSSQVSNGDTSNWFLLLYDTVAKSETSYIDCNVTSGETYYYKISAFDSHLTNGTKFYNIAWFSNTISKTAVKIDTMTANNWYVNISSGDTENDGLSVNSPKKYIRNIIGSNGIGLLTAGDTINISAGDYCETITINTNAISIIGADSSTTQIHAPGDSSVNTLYGISVTNKNNILIKNLKFYNFYHGIYFNDVDTSIIENVWINHCGSTSSFGYAFYLLGGADSNLIKNCFSENNHDGLYISSSYYNHIEGNHISNSVSGYGIKLQGAQNSYFGDNLIDSNQTNIEMTSLSNCISNTFYNNTIKNGQYNINMESSNNSNTFYGNTLINGQNYSIQSVSCNNNIYNGNTFINNPNAALIIQAGAGNTVTNNIIKNNSGVYSLSLLQMSTTSVFNNIITNNFGSGIYLYQSHNNSIKNNFISNNLSQGIYNRDSNNNYYAQNTIDSCGNYCVYLEGNSSFDTFIENNIYPSQYFSDSAIYNECDSNFYFKNNFWVTTDTIQISNKIKGAYTNRILFQPFRFSFIDTAIGADTIAPNTMTITAYDTIITSRVTIYFDTPIFDESGQTLDYDNDTHIYGFHIFRALKNQLDVNEDTSDWQKYLYDTIIVSSANKPNFYNDYSVSSGETYYYKITAFDSHITDGQLFYNECWYSNTMKVYNIGGIDTMQPNNWYIDISLGDTNNHGLSLSAPKKYIGNVTGNVYGSLVLLTQGDTINIAAGTYSETVVIDTDNISIIGVDSSLTIIDPPGDSNISTLNGIEISDQSYINISNLKITDCYYGMFLSNLDSSIISNCYIEKCGKISGNGAAISLANSSEFNIIKNCIFTGSFNGINLSGSQNNNIRECQALNNEASGFYTSSSNNNIFDSNKCNNSLGSDGFYFLSSNENILINNISNNNYNHGFRFYLNSNNNTLISNSASNNNLDGFAIIYSDSNILKHNISNLNSEYGIYLNIANENIISQNEIYKNNYYGIYIVGNSSGDTILKNNFTTSIINPDSAAYIGGDTFFDFRYNYWSITDSPLINSRIIGNGLIFTPFRTINIDTAINADTVAPKMPAFISADTSTVGQIILRWTKPIQDENSITLGGADSDLFGYRLYRYTAADTDNWESYCIAIISDKNDTDYFDTVSLGDSYYYRIVSFDSHYNNGVNFQNRSWYSSNFYVFAGAPHYDSYIWFVNDLSLVDDSYTNLAGSDLLGNGSKTFPYRTIAKALSKAHANDTIFVDAGTYTEAVIIDTNNISLIGVDSSLTIIDPAGDSSSTTLFGIFADTQTGLTIRNFKIVDCYHGIYFSDVDTSNISDVTVYNCGKTSSAGKGIYIGISSMNNIIQNSYLDRNCVGIFFNSNNYNYILNNTISNCLQYGIYTGGSYTTILNNKISAVNSCAIYIVSNSNTIDSNILTNNSSGINILGCSANTVRNNFITNTNGFALYIYSSTNDIVKNNIIANQSNYGLYLETVTNSFIKENFIRNSYADSGFGIYLKSSSGNYFAQNTVDSNSRYAIALAGICNADTFEKNNFNGSQLFEDSVVYNYCDTNFSFINNYWTTADSAGIKNKIYTIYPNRIIYSPFRTSGIDTVAGADTIAPETLSIYFVDTSIFGQISLRWTKPLNDENANSLGTADTDLFGYRIYRALSSECRANGDTDNWEIKCIAVLNNKIDTYYNDTPVIQGQTYFYRITAYDSYMRGALNFQNRSWYSPSYSVYAPSGNTAPNTPVLLLPVNLPAPYTEFDTYGRTLNLRPKLFWQCPVDIDSNKLHFKVYLDIQGSYSLFGNSLAETTYFSYFNGVSFDSFPNAGLDSSVYGNTVYFIPPSNLGEVIYNWTVTAFDGTAYSDSELFRNFKIGGRSWTDSDVAAGSTPIRKIHIDELREETNFARKFRGLPAYNWTDSNIIPGVTLIRKIHIDELRLAQEQTAASVYLPAPIWTNPGLTAGQSIIRKIHFEELRIKLSEY